MAKVRIELNIAGIGKILKSDELMGVCKAEAERMTRATEMNYKTDSYRAKSRVVSETIPTGEDAEHPICPKCGEAHYHCRCRR